MTATRWFGPAALNVRSSTGRWRTGMGSAGYAQTAAVGARSEGMNMEQSCENCGSFYGLHFDECITGEGEKNVNQCADGCGSELAQYDMSPGLCEFCESNYVVYRRQHPELFAHLRVQWLNDRDRKFFIHDREVAKVEYFIDAYAIYTNR